ncbi:MAG: aldo/keto reductase [Sedimentisphaerales bacterium]|jgi:aryl-alcohol dehydrogenase-like predicted oxidoreductase
MSGKRITRRQFIKGTAALAGATLLSSCNIGPLPKGRKLTAVDQVPLGKTGLKLSRLGFGTGSRGGSIQRALGADGFNRLIRYAYDQGITYFDTAENYGTHTMVREAIRSLPREKLFIQSKMPGVPDKPLEVLDRYRKEMGVDYIDSLLVHCGFKSDWDEERKRLLDAFEEAKARKLIRAHGVSCHSLPALTKAAQLDWVDVNLVRINPQGAHIDTPVESWDAQSNASYLPAVLEQIKVMREKRHGIIGMKIIGDGDFTEPEDREKSIRFTMQSGLVDAVVIGFKSTVEIDEAIMRINNALAQTA